jgi:phosphoribosylamine-glycine ligase
MRYFFHSTYGDGLALVDMLQKEGCEVHVFLKEKPYQKMYEGFCKIPKYHTVEQWRNRIQKDDIVVFDSVASGDIGDWIRKYRTQNVIGGQVIADKLELDRVFGLQVMADCGIKIPTTYPFTTIRDGIVFAKANSGRWVFKPYGSKQDVSSVTYVSDSTTDLIDFMKGLEDQKYILQEFKEGKELSTEVWFSRGIPIGPCIHDVETKRFMNDDLGCNTGCQSSIEWYVPGLHSKAIHEGIGKAFDYMFRVKYTGSLDLNSIIDKSGNLWGIEWTARMGYSAEYALFELLKERLTGFFKRVAVGTMQDILFEDKYGFALRVSIPPYPLEASNHDKEQENAVNHLMRAQSGIEVKTKDIPGVNYRYLDCYKKDDKYFTAGCDGIILEICTKSDSLESGDKKIYEAADALICGNKQYRTDGFDRAKKHIPLLEKLGYGI